MYFPQSSSELLSFFLVRKKLFIIYHKFDYSFLHGITENGSENKSLLLRKVNNKSTVGPWSY